MSLGFKTYFRCACGLEERAEGDEVIVCLASDRSHHLDRFGVRTEQQPSRALQLVSQRLTLTDLELRRLHWRLRPADLHELELYDKLRAMRRAIMEEEFASWKF